MPFTGLSNNIEFYNNCNIKFNNKFEYYNDYTGINNDINILCKIHNYKFISTPKNHLRSDTGSCRLCKTIKMKEIKSVDQKYFTKKSKNIFGEKFDYSLVNYKNKKDKIKLKCTIHNFVFEIEPKSHYYSNTGGCTECNNHNKINKKNNIIIEYQKIYNNLFTFYKNELNKIYCNLCKNIFNFNLRKNIEDKIICPNCIKNKEIIFKEKQQLIKNTIKMKTILDFDEEIKKIKINGLEDFIISNKGKIFDKHKKLMCCHKNQNGYITVRLHNNIENKNILYRVHRLVCETYLEKINGKNIVDHINRIRDDNNIKNLRWVTIKENNNNKNQKNIYENKKNIININDEEFKIINSSIYGNFSNYSISNYGKILNNKNNKYISQKNTDEGYIRVTLNSDANKKYSIYVHRIVCEIFNNKPENNKLVVNHIDENKSNNYYKNLEWVTIKKNNQHSKNKKIAMLNDSNKVINTFDSITHAYDFLNKKYSGNIQKQIKNNKKAYGYFWKII